MNKNKKYAVAKPLITIITATYNASLYLPSTLESIRSQTNKNFEWIIIDNCSSDSTLEIVIKSKDIIAKFISEPDAGIYDAWNKGIKISRGQWICFVGAGDVLDFNAVDIFISVINKNLTKSIDLIHAMGISRNNGLFGRNLVWKDFQKYMTVCHVAALHNVKLFSKYGLFDSNFKTSGDYEFLLRTQGHLNTYFIEKPLVTILDGGISSGYSSIFETYLIHRKYHLFSICLFRAAIALMKKFLRNIFSKVFKSTC
jgi:glycosyltransferase involved in cell wall biosynthesis